MKICKQCSASFEIAPEDMDFLDRLSPVIKGKKYLIPEPTLCFDCCFQRRQAFRNEINFYKRPSGFSGKPMVSIYSPDKPDVVYSYDEWWSDKWDSFEYGRDFDFNQPFFEQFKKLFKEVPKINLIQDGTSVNSDYTNFGSRNKNCYLALCVQCEDFYYGSGMGAKNCMDCFHIIFCEKCYECVDCNKCYNSAYLQNSRQCSDSYFLESCVNCRNCLGCKNLNNKEFHIFNKPYSKEEYDRLIKSYQLDIYLNIEKFKKQFQSFKLTLPFRYCQNKSIENSTGDFLDGASNCHHCFEVVAGGQDFRYCVVAGANSHDLFNCSNNIASMFNYEADGLGNSQNILFSHFIRDCHNLIYCIYCYNCQNCFGCTGLHRKEYCILNKQYTKEEYEELVPKIIQHMRSTHSASSGSCEWGEFFPVTLSSFAYNETVANDYFSMTREEILDRGWKWFDYKPEVKAERLIPSNRLPDKIEDVPDDILNWAIICEVTGQPFKIIPQELKFYREHHLPLPHCCFIHRHINRFRQRNPYKLWDRKCDKCGVDIETSFAPDRPETVYCEQCYLAEVY